MASHELHRQPLRKNDEGEAPAPAPGRGGQTAERFSLPGLQLLERNGLYRPLLPEFDYLAQGAGFGPAWPEVKPMETAGTEWRHMKRR